MNGNGKWHAWYSQKSRDSRIGGHYQFESEYDWNNDKYTTVAKKVPGTVCVYLKEDGTEVEVTEVSSNDKPSSLFDDNVYVGIVTQWVRNVPA